MFDFILFLKATILGVIQGLTEFIPVSSTAHTVLAGKLLQLDDEFTNTFSICIQLGATSALIWYFRKDLFARLCGLLNKKSDRKFAFYLLIAFLPAAIVGLLFHKKIEYLLASVIYLGIAQILGACLILVAEKMSSKFDNRTNELNKISWNQALAVGLWQIASLWPGMSRSGSTIMGGLLAKIDRPTATQFSFYLSIPVAVSSSAFMIFKHYSTFASVQNMWLLCVGFLAAFFTGLLVVRFIMQFVRTHSFNIFAYYRIALGLIILFLATR